MFCHEHTQILNGTVCFVELSGDLTRAVSEPIELFDAGSYLKKVATESSHNVTDGPFMYKMEDGKLLMIWSTCTDSYVQCIAPHQFYRWKRIVDKYVGKRTNRPIYIIHYRLCSINIALLEADIMY